MISTKLFVVSSRKMIMFGIIIWLDDQLPGDNVIMWKTTSFSGNVIHCIQSRWKTPRVVLCLRNLRLAGDH